jgi:hypothetical protein
MRVGAPFDSNAQVWTAITQPRPKTNLIARSLKMKQGQDEWGRDEPYSRPLGFNRLGFLPEVPALRGNLRQKKWNLRQKKWNLRQKK